MGKNEKLIPSSRIEFSNYDVQSQLIIPDKLTPDLAEFIGIIIGDGHVALYKSCKPGNSFSHYEIKVCGNLRDKRYYESFVQNLFIKLFNTKVTLIASKHNNSFIVSKNSKAIHSLLARVMNIPPKKDNVEFLTL